MRFTHTRADWVDPAMPVTGPAFPSWSDIDLIVIHYPGVINVPDGDSGESLASIPPYLRSTQAYYVQSRGYSVGYNAAVDWTGGTWELRGDTYKSAATKALNHRSIAIKLIVDIGTPATAAAVAGVRDLVAQIRAHAPTAKIIGHRDGPKYAAGATHTACPGDAVYAQLQAGMFEPASAPPEPSPPPPPPPSIVQGVPHMFLVARETTSQTIWCSPNGGISRVGLRNLDQLELIITAGALNAANGSRLTPRGAGESWKQITAISSGALNARLGPAA